MRLASSRQQASSRCLGHFWHGFNVALPGAQDDGPTNSHSLACVNRALGRDVGVSSFGGRCLDRCSGDTSSLVAK
jgi:hypothetical protein